MRAMASLTASYYFTLSPLKSMFWQSIWDLQFAKHRIKFSILSSLSQRNLIVSVVFLNFVFDVLAFSPSCHPCFWHVMYNTAQRKITVFSAARFTTWTQNFGHLSPGWDFIAITCKISARLAGLKIPAGVVQSGLETSARAETFYM